LGNLVYLSVVSAGSGPSAVQGVAVVGSVVVLAGTWVVAARRAEFAPGVDLVCVVGLGLAGYAAPAVVDGTTLFGVALIYRGVFGGDVLTRSEHLSGVPYRAAGLYLAAYVGGQFVDEGSASQLMADLVFLAPVAVSTMVIGRVLARNAAGRDRALQRESVLGEATRALGAATDPAGIYQIVVRAALSLLGSVEGARVTLLVPDEGGGYSAVAAEGSLSLLRGLRAGELPVRLELALQQGAEHWCTPGELRELAQAFHVSRLLPSALMLPLRLGGQAVCPLFAAFLVRPGVEFVNALGVLVGEAASELQGAALGAQLAYQAQHDSLTGLVNRAEWGQRLDSAVARRAAAVGTATAVLFIDLDDFKTINDTFGHACGDEVLKAVAARLAGCLRASDVVGRLGGDEFAVVLDPVADEAEARSIAARMVDAVSRPVAVSTGQVPCSASVGVALWTPGLSASELLARADTAMYVAKEQRNAVASYDPRRAPATAGRAE
jgi:diguanylate cyclase (GGDEF)-like protein